MSSKTTLNKLTAIIVDDELHGRENLKKIIENYCPEIEMLACADSVINAKKLVYNHKPEVVFLDINMPVLDGFDFLDEYDDRNFMVVIVSAHEDYGINAVKADVIDYLLKPINIKELKLTVKKLISIKNKRTQVEIVQENDKLVIPSTHGFKVVVFDDIMHLEADGCYTTIFVKDGKKIVVSRTLKDFEDILSKVNFFRIHKSHLINLKYVKDYSNLSGNLVTMADGNKVEISRRKAPLFIQQIKKLLNTV